MDRLSQGTAKSWEELQQALVARFQEQAVRCSGCAEGVGKGQLAERLCQGVCPKSGNCICANRNEVLCPICMELQPGTKVRKKGCQVEAMVVADVSGVCRPGYVMVEMDGFPNVTSIRLKDLEVVGFVEVFTDQAKCQRCAYLGGAGQCLRYGSQRFEAFVGRSGRVVPVRIYPYCQDEVCGQAGLHKAS